jgi:ribosomal protein S19E (S16A)
MAMSDPPEDVLSQAERHVREGEERIARQTAVVEELERDGHVHAAGKARVLLATLQAVLDTWHADLARLRRPRDGHGS